MTVSRTLGVPNPGPCAGYSGASTAADPSIRYFTSRETMVWGPTIRTLTVTSDAVCSHMPPTSP